MKRLVLFFTALLVTLGVMAGGYRNFRATAYIMAGDVNRIGTVENWEKSYAEFSKNLKLDKVYIETFQDMTYSDDKALDAAIKFFRSKGKVPLDKSSAAEPRSKALSFVEWDLSSYENPQLRITSSRWKLPESLLSYLFRNRS